MQEENATNQVADAQFMWFNARYSARRNHQLIWDHLASSSAHCRRCNQTFPRRLDELQEYPTEHCAAGGADLQPTRFCYIFTLGGCLLGNGAISARLVCCGNDPVYMSRKIRKFRTDKFDTWNKRKFYSCNSCKRLGTSRLHELHESKFPFVSRIEFIRSKLSNFSAHVYGASD